MSDPDRPPPPPLSPPSDEQDPREPAGGSLRAGILAATGLGLAAFLITYALTPSPDVGGGTTQTAEAWLTFTFAELPLLLVIAAVLLCIRRMRRTGGGMMIGAAVAMIVTTRVCRVAD